MFGEGHFFAWALQGFKLAQGYLCSLSKSSLALTPHFPKEIAESMVQHFAAARSIVAKSHHFNPGGWQGTFIFRQCICRLPSKPSRKHQIKSHPKASTSGLAPTASAALGSQVVQSFTNTIHHCCETCKCSWDTHPKRQLKTEALHPLAPGLHQLE